MPKSIQTKTILNKTKRRDPNFSVAIDHGCKKPGTGSSGHNSNRKLYMKTVVATKYGPPEILQIKDAPKPIPKDNEVLIKIHAASINSWDWDLIRGKPRIYRLLFGLFKPKHPVIGSDIAGTIESVGKNIKNFQPGDAVFGDVSGCGFGAFAEYVCAPERFIALKPAKLTWEEAAAIPQAGLLALQGLKGKLKEGQHILINGAGGGVGTFAIQLAKMWGAEVTAVDRTDKLGLMRSLGADHVINYMHEDFTRNGIQYAVILDNVAKRSVFDYLRALRKGGTMSVVGGSISSIFQTLLLGGWVSRNKKIGLLAYKFRSNDLDYLGALCESGKIKPIIDRQYPLQETPKAIQRLGEGQVMGKIIINI